MKGAPEEVIQAALDRIGELGYLDDRGYAVRRAQLMAERGYSDRFIAYRLAEIGIPEEMAEQAVQALPQNLKEEKRIRMLLKKEKDRKKDPVKFLASRGFDFDAIYRVLGGDER